MQGYYRWPTIHADTIVFGSEDDIWSVPVRGGVCRRLTANLAVLSHPFFSPDGQSLAFSGREEGHLEVYTMPSEGGPIRRLTYLGASSNAIGWSPDAAGILFSSDAHQPFSGVGCVMSVGRDGGEPVAQPYGPAVSITFGPNGGVAIGRHSNDPARWKRYRGGTAGDIWVDPDGSGQFAPLVSLRGNMARPMWIGERIYFLSDHEGVGNIYSCLATGSDLHRHTHNLEYFVRFPNTDGQRIVFHAGADLYVYDAQTNSTERVEVRYASPRVQRQRKFVSASKYLEEYAAHPQGHSLAVTSRGQCFAIGNWEGAALPVTDPQHGFGEGRAEVRYRCTRWLNDGKRLVTIADSGGEEVLEVRDPDGASEPVRYAGLDLGRVYALAVSPVTDEVVLWNNRRELVLVDLGSGSHSVLDRNTLGSLNGATWSPDGQWIAYTASVSRERSAIMLWSKETGKITQATEPVLRDAAPGFDPEGKYLYFIGQRDLNPVYDGLHFDLGFPKGTRPFLVTLRKELLSPFAPVPRPLEEPAKAAADAKSEKDAEPCAAQPKPVVIDVEGIRDRVVGFPVPEGRYVQVTGIKGKVLLLSVPVEGALQQDFLNRDDTAKGTLEIFDLDTLKLETVLTSVSDFEVAPDGKTLVYRSKDRLRVRKAGEKPDEKLSAEPPGRRSGWVNLSRIRVSVDPGAEWRQMAREAWRLQREYFWTPSMSDVDWDAVWNRYAPLLERVGTRAEFSDLMWEMQGELGTSHAYEMGGDHRPEPDYHQGFLGAEFSWDSADQGYRVARIVEGTPGEQAAQSPLRAPGINIEPGAVVLAVNGRRLSEALTVQQALVNQAGQEVVLSVRDGENQRSVTVRALRSEFPVRYREWVERNRRVVHQRTGERAGYVHIPDMGPAGYAEFHRLYLSEVEYDALVVDVRFNRGGHVSQLILEKLARKRIGYDVQRWGPPEPYPSYSVAGPMVMLTNQYAGSDGDIVSHCFKLMQLGPLIGTRTWGGVIGIGPHNPLVDGSITTQPEYSFWFTDVGWGVENYGTDPDIEVQTAPQDYASGKDPQLDAAIAAVLQRLEACPPLKPSFDNRPSLALPGGLPRSPDAQ